MIGGGVLGGWEEEGRREKSGRSRCSRKETRRESRCSAREQMCTAARQALQSAIVRVASSRSRSRSRSRSLTWRLRAAWPSS